MTREDLPGGMTIELARRLYGSVEVDWASEPFVFDVARSECRFWLDHGSSTSMFDDDAYDGMQWPPLVNVIRRGDDNKVRVFQWGNGLVFEQTT
jgi:hypothetical protein